MVARYVTLFLPIIYVEGFSLVIHVYDNKLDLNDQQYCLDYRHMYVTITQTIPFQFLREYACKHCVYLVLSLIIISSQLPHLPLALPNSYEGFYCQ